MYKIKEIPSMMNLQAIIKINNRLVKKKMKLYKKNAIQQIIKKI